MISPTKYTKNVLVGSPAVLIRDEIHCNEYPGTRRVMSVGYLGSKFSARFNPIGYTIPKYACSCDCAWRVTPDVELTFRASPGILLPLLNGYNAHSSHWKDTPFHWSFGGKTPPIWAKTRTFVVRKITPFSDFKESTLHDDPFKTNWGHSLQL